MLKKLSLLTFIPLAVPLIAWAMNWHWAGDNHLIATIDYPLYFLTETGSAPFALLTCVVLMLWLILLTRRQYSWLLVGFVCATSVIGTQIIKTGAKHLFAEPRPYVEQITQGNTDYFYAQARSQREILVQNAYENAVAQANAQGDEGYAHIVSHRQHETGYSFPSGHTIFAVSWLLVFGGFLLKNNGAAGLFAQMLISVWAVLMLVSRLRLGMHFPIDLFASTLIAWAFHFVLFIWGVPYLQRLALFKQRGA